MSPNVYLKALIVRKSALVYVIFPLIIPYLRYECVSVIPADYNFEFKMNFLDAIAPWCSYSQGVEAGEWYVDLKNGSGSAGSGTAPGGSPDVTMKMDSEDFVKMFQGEMKPTAAFMSGKLEIDGDLMKAMKLETLMKKLPSSKL